MDAQVADGGVENIISTFDRNIWAKLRIPADCNIQHRLPVNIQPEVQVTATVPPKNFIEVSEEVVISDTPDCPEPVTGSVDAPVQEVPDPHQTGLKSPVNKPQPARRRLRPRQRRNSQNSNSTFLQQWVKKLERDRVQAEKKMAAATLIIAEAANKIAEASLTNAETNRMNAETNRKQFEVMKAIMDVVRQPVQPSSVRLRAEDSSQSEKEITVFCPKCNMEVSHTAVLQTKKEEERRNADKRLEPPEKRRSARKRSEQMDSSSDAHSTVDNEDDNEQSSNSHDEEPEIKVGPAAVKVEHNDIEVNREQADTDPIYIDVHTEPCDNEVDIRNKTLAHNEPTGTKRKGRKILRRRRSGVTSLRRTFTVKEKAEIISKMKNGENNADLCKEYKVPHSTISTMWKNRDKILECFESKSLKIKKIRKPMHQDVEKALLVWFKAQRSQNVPLSGRQLQEKANHFARLFGKMDFQCSESWIYRFRQRHDIVVGKICGEAASVSQNDCDNWVQTVYPKLTEDSQIWNADKTEGVC